VTRLIGGTVRGIAGSRWIQAVALASTVLVGNAAYVSWHLGLLHRPRQVGETDHRTYIRMAQAPPPRWDRPVEAPFAYRVAAPYLVFLATRAGLDLHVSFYLLTNLSLLGFLVTLFLDLRSRGFQAGLGALGVIWVGLLPGAVRWYEYQYWMTDPPCLFLVALGVHLTRRRAPTWMLAATCAAAAAFRETAVILIPYVFLHDMRRGGSRAALFRSVPIAGVTLAVLVGIRELLVPLPPDDVLLTVRENVAFRLRHLFDNQLYVATLGSFGVLLPLATLYPARAWRAVRARIDDVAVVAVAYGSLLLANNTDRLLAYSVPVVVPAALRGLRSAAVLARRRLPALAAASLAPQALLFAKSRFHDLVGASLYQPSSLAVTAAMALFWLLLRGLVASRPSRGRI
jgi:hypothetical protein